MDDEHRTEPAKAVPATAPTPDPVPDYDESGVPTLDHVRDKIEGRYARSLGATELAEGTAAAQSAEEQQAAREKAGRDRLEEIRRSMRADD